MLKNSITAMDERERAAIRAAFAAVQQQAPGGQVYSAQNVPGLSDADPDAGLALAVVAVDGTQLLLGDSSRRILAQSSFKPLVLGFVLKHVGSIDSLVADTGCKGYRADTTEPDGRAHNPLINSGVLCVMHLARQGGCQVDQVVEFVQRLAGTSAGVAVNQRAYTATREDSAHNLSFCQSLRCFPQDEHAAEHAVDWYSRLDCLESTVCGFAHVAATLANGGLSLNAGPRGDNTLSQGGRQNPDALLSSQATAAVLSAMLGSGMYEASGQWLREIGLPAKSGVSGIIVAVVPGRFGIVSHCARIDTEGNSVRGVAFFRELLRRLPELSIFRFAPASSLEDPLISSL